MWLRTYLAPKKLVFSAVSGRNVIIQDLRTSIEQRPSNSSRICEFQHHLVSLGNGACCCGLRSKYLLSLSEKSYRVRGSTRGILYGYQKEVTSRSHIYLLDPSNVKQLPASAKLHLQVSRHLPLLCIIRQPPSGHCSCLSMRPRHELSREGT